MANITSIGWPPTSGQIPPGAISLRQSGFWLPTTVHKSTNRGMERIMADLLKDLDYFDLDEFLTSEEKMTRNTVKQFVQREILPNIEQHFANETFPRDIIPQMAELGFFGANLKGYGCAGMGNVAYGLIMQELEAGEWGRCSFASVQSAPAM